MKKLLMLCITAFMLVLAACTVTAMLKKVSESEEDAGSGAEAIDFSIMALPNSLDPHAPTMVIHFT